MIDADRAVRALQATWPPARAWRDGPWTRRDGGGGGKRVSAATAEAPVTDFDLSRLDEGLAMVRPGETSLDRLLADAGWQAIDPTLLLAAPASFDTPGPPVVVSDRPIAIHREVWAEGGIGPGRLAVMARAGGAYLLGRAGDRVAGVGFVAVDGDVAMLHALEVRPAFRRQGVGGAMTAAAARWAADRGARTLALAVTEANAMARSLYARLGMAEIGRYHYRSRP